MRFKHFLSEMTVRAGDLRKGIEPLRIEYEPKMIKEGKYIGDLKNLDIEYKVFQSKLDGNIQYGLYDGETLVTMFDGRFRKFVDISKCYYLERMITIREYAGQHLSAKLLMFLKTREKIPVIFGDIHSRDTVHNVRKISKTIPHLQVKWLNVATGDVDPFDPETDDKDTKHIFGQNGPTKWRIMIEGNGQFAIVDGVKTRCFHFLHEGEKNDLTKDYNMWDMVYGNEDLEREIYTEGL